MRKLSIFLWCIIFIMPLWAADQEGNNSPTILTPDYQLRVHRASNIAFSITNFGKIGSEGRDLIDPETFLPAPSCEYPRDSGIEYLFQGCLWIGAIVEDPDEPWLSDTLVSIADDGWWSGIYELNPLPPGNQTIWKEHEIGDEEYYAVYYDTITFDVTPDPNDNRPHRPLGLKITQHSLCWSTPGYDEFFVINYYIENFYDRPIEDMWIGLYYDGDVYHISEDPYGSEQGAQDDLCGFIEHGNFGIGWIADNDGQPDGVYNDSSSLNVMALYLLGSSTPGLQTNFNWWISNIYSELDWGPAWTEHDRIFPGGGRGTPGGDPAKYFVMSNGEHDYDQAYSALDWTDEGWIPNYSQDPDNLANGYDARFLISFGPLQFSAGEVETVTVAYIGGCDLHTDPANYNLYLRHMTRDSVSIDEYYANLDFSDLLTKADSVLAYYQSGYDRIPLGPPHDFHLTGWGSDHVDLAWQHEDHEMLAEYRIYRGTQPGVYDPEPITPPGFIDSAYTDTGLDDNTYYYYVIDRVNTYGREGGLSNEVVINTGQPSAPTGLTAVRGDQQINLTWQDNPEGDIQGYIIYRALYHPTYDFEIIDTAEGNYYQDNNLANGFRYYYKLKALDIYGIASYFSDTASAVPMGLNQGILLINANYPDVNHNPDYDSMCVFYESMLENSQMPFEIIDSTPDTISVMADHEIVVYSSEFLYQMRDAFYSYDFLNMVAAYLDGGGKLIVVGPRNLYSFTYFGTIMFQANEVFYTHLNLAGINQSRYNNDEFVGGSSLNPSYPDFDLDTARVNRMIWPVDQDNGRMFGVGNLIPRDSSEVIYNYVAVNPDTSEYHGNPIGIIHHAENYSVAVLGFPLYYIEQESAFEIFNQIIYEFNAVGIPDNDDQYRPEKTSLLCNYPNPFNAVTTIKYELKSSFDVSITIYDILGRKIDNIEAGRQAAGSHSIVWDARNLATGVYFYKIQAGNNVDIRKCLLLK